MSLFWVSTVKQQKKGTLGGFLGRLLQQKERKRTQKRFLLRLRWRSRKKSLLFLPFNLFQLNTKWRRARFRSTQVEGFSNYKFQVEKSPFPINSSWRFLIFKDCFKPFSTINSKLRRARFWSIEIKVWNCFKGYSNLFQVSPKFRKVHMWPTQSSNNVFFLNMFFLIWTFRYKNHWVKT